MTAEARLEQVRKESVFTCGIPFEQFVEELCKRYARIYGEILPIKDYEYIVKRLEAKRVI